MENNFKIVPLFPTPIYVGKIPNNLSPIVNFLDSQEMNYNPTIKDASLEYGTRSLNTYILNETSCLKLSNYILSQTLIYATEYLGYDYTKYKFSQSWVSHKSPGESHITHTHPNSLISGILYYGNYDENTPGLVIAKPSQNHNLLPRIPQTQLPNPQLNSTHFSFNPTPGDLLFFPSWLPHMVPKNTTNNVRKSLAFNIVPTEGFGNEMGLTELKFN